MNDIVALYPMPAKYSDVVPDVMLTGKLIVFENCFVFEDSYMHNFFVDYKNIEKVTFYTGKKTWGDFKVSDIS